MDIIILLICTGFIIAGICCEMYLYNKKRAFDRYEKELLRKIYRDRATQAAAIRLKEHKAEQAKAKKL